MEVDGKDLTFSGVQYVTDLPFTFQVTDLYQISTSHNKFNLYYYYYNNPDIRTLYENLK